MSTHTIAETVKEMVQKSEAITRATFIANRKEVMIKRWWDDFNDTTDRSFEVLYSSWEIDAFWGILGERYSIPSLEVCEDALNNTACKWKRFNSFFQEHLKLKK